jgi:septum site-determining protein MinC
MQAPPEVEGTRAATARRPSDPARARPEPAFELKGVVAPLTVLRLRSTEINVIERQLRIKIAEMPQFFLHAPVLLDLGALGDAAAELSFGDIAATLRSCRMVPVAITNATQKIRDLAAEAGFGFVVPPSARATARGGATDASEAHSQLASDETSPQQGSGSARSSARGAGAGTPAPEAIPSPPPSPRPVARSHRPALVIRQPVRSGQIIYAERNDVVVLASVNPGAEVIADGNVHIYGALRGRVVAGAQGFIEARIFCQRMEAELVAVSGAYMLADDIPPALLGKPAQIYLEDGVCRVAAL